MPLHFCLYFSYLVSLGKQLSTVVLEAYFYVGPSLGSLCGLFFFFFFFFFDIKVAFGLDAFCLLRQCALAIIPLIGSEPVYGLCVLPGRWRQLEGPLATAGCGPLVVVKTNGKM